VHFFDPFKVQIAGDSVVAAGLDLLGRRKTPDWRDHVDFLHQIAVHRGDESCGPEETKQVLYSLNQVAVTMPSDEGVAQELFILLTSGKLGTAGNAWANDVPHWKGRLDLRSLDVVDDRVPPRLRYLAKQLSQHVTEHLDDEPVRSLDRHLGSFCNQVTRTICSPEFAAGHRRLVSYEFQGIFDGYEQNAADLELIPAVSIRTHFWLNDGANSRQIGGGATKFFLDREAGQIWIGTASSRSACPHLARAINRYCDPFQLKDLSSLEAILSVPPEEIAEILNEREVPDIGVDPQGDWQFEVPANSDEEAISDTPESDNEGWSMGAAEEGNATTGEPRDDPFGVAGNNTPKRGGVSVPSSTIASAQGGANAARQGRSGGSRSSVAPRPQPQKIDGVNARSSTDSAPPTMPGHGTSGGSPVGTGSRGEPSRNRSPRQRGTKGDSSQKGRYVTYVVPGGGGAESNGRDGMPDSEPSDSEARDIGAAAVKIALDFEREYGRRPKEMPHHNPGYDVISEGQPGELRYIEVKGIDGAWGERGVALSHTQFKFAQHRAGEAWLYVVEHARGPLEPIVHPIQAPATKVMQFFFDAGWKTVANVVAVPSNTTAARPGDEVMIEDGEVVKVTAVETMGDLIRIEVLDERDGSVRKVAWQPGHHIIVRRDELGADDTGAA
jgi:hypothetical protein